MAIYAEDKKLVRRLLAGDERAFAQFFNDNFARLYRFALARLPNDPSAAEDVVQTTLTKGLRHVTKYRGEAALFTWLCVICRNELAEWARRSARHRVNTVLTEDFPAIRRVVESLDSSTGGVALSGPQRLEISRLIQVTLDRLPAAYGDALEWKYIDGYSVREIALRLQITPQATQSLLARARRAFKDVYATLVDPVAQPGKAQKEST